MIKLLTISLLFLGCSSFLTIEGGKLIQPDNKNIIIDGAFFIEKNSKRVIINRFNNEFFSNKKTFANKEKANTQSGVSISFSTNSPKVTMYFEERSDAQHRQKVFGIYKNGKFFKKVSGTKFSFTNTDANYADWKIVLPTFCGVDFTGVEIENNSELKKVRQKKKPVYVAIGNSITHGVGQNGAGYLTYPFLLAQEKNWDLYNLAVGGSKISWPVAEILKNKKVDVITVLWGYNDWNSTFTIKDNIKPYYKKLISELRRVQPNAKIYCILPTTSKSTSPKNGDDSLQDIRDAEKDVVQSFQQNGDSNLFIIDGKKLTTISGLNDDVHFSVDGAAKFAKQLKEIIN